MSSKIYGQTAHLAICFQNSFGTSNVASLFTIPFTGESIALEKEEMIDDGMRGVYDEGDTYEGKNQAPGDIDATGQCIPLGALMRATLADPVSTKEASADVYQHVFTPAQIDFDEFSAMTPVTVYKYLNTGSAQLFYDLNGNTLELDMPNGDFVKAKASFVGGNFDQQANVAASYPVGKRWTWDVASLAVGGTAQPEVNAFNLKVENGIEPQWALDSSRGKFPRWLKRSSNRVVTISGTLRFSNTDEYDQFIAQSERELVMTLTGPVDISSGYQDTLKIEAPMFRYAEFKPMAGGPGPIDVSFTAKAKYSVDSGFPVRITLTNSQTGY